MRTMQRPVGLATALTPLAKAACWLGRSDIDATREQPWNATALTLVRPPPAADTCRSVPERASQAPNHFRRGVGWSHCDTTLELHSSDGAGVVRTHAQHSEVIN